MCGDFYKIGQKKSELYTKITIHSVLLFLMGKTISVIYG